MDSKLRVGLLLDSFFLPAWQLAAIKRIVSSAHAECALLILNQPQQKQHSRLRAFWQHWDHWLYRAFNILDERLFIRGQKASALVDATDVLLNIPVLNVTAVDENGRQHFSATDVDQIKTHNLDLLIKLGFGDLDGAIMCASTYGVWAYRWGDHRKIENGLTSFWEVVNGWTETGAGLQQLGVDGKAHKILFESWLFTYPFSPARSRNYILWSAASYLPRQIERLCRVGAETYFEELKVTSHEDPGILQSNQIPSNLETLKSIAKLTIRNLVEIYRRIFIREQWELLFGFGGEIDDDLSTFSKISPPKDRFWADPHVIYKGPNYYIFVEEFPFRTKRGHISVIEMDRQGNYKKPVPVLQKDYHLSFPFVFHEMGKYYMIPETSENRTIDLYECVEFPCQWQHRITLMKDVRAVDTTVVYAQGKWWLFTAMAEQDAAAAQVELFLFYSNELFTDQWQPHPMNPIVSDIKRARGAGAIFRKNGKLFRPSQDCSKGYGYGFDLNEIVTLSETDYCERTVKSVTPESTKHAIATHTYANQGGLTVVDALTLHPKRVKQSDSIEVLVTSQHHD